MTETLPSQPSTPGAIGQPTLGAVIPLFGDVGFMRECLRSLQEQTQPFDVVVLVDDATGNPEVRALMQQAVAATDTWVSIGLDENQGIVGATNVGIEACPTDYIAFVDCDDLLHPEAAQTVREHLQRSDTDLLASRYATFTTDPALSTDVGMLDLQGVYPSAQHLILEHMYLSHLKVARASFLKQVGGFKPGTDGVQDWHLAVDAVLGGTFRVIDRVLYFHRVHASQATHTARADFFRSVNERRLGVVPDLPERQRRVAAVTPALQGLATLLNEGANHQSLPGLLLAGGGPGGLRALPGSLPWWDLIAHERQHEWVAYLGTSWLDLGALESGLRRSDAPLQGLVVSRKSPTSIHMARWYSGYCDFLLVLDPIAETALYDYLPGPLPVIITQPGQTS